MGTNQRLLDNTVDASLPNNFVLFNGLQTVTNSLRGGGPAGRAVLSDTSVARNECLKQENTGGLCACRNCFFDWWDSLPMPWKNRISNWLCLIEAERGYETPGNLSLLDNNNIAEVEEYKNDEESTDWHGHGVQLYDDEIDVYCDRLQQAVAESGRQIDGCFAIQYVYGACDSIALTGQNQILQVVYDERGLGHFILLEWVPGEQTVLVYDSILPDDDAPHNTLTSLIQRQIRFLFGHIGGETISIRIERNIQLQEDGWSCGLRCIGLITLRALQLSATGCNLNLKKLSLLMHSVNRKSNASIEDFMQIHEACKEFNNTEIKEPLFINLPSTENLESTDDINKGRTNNE